MEYYLAMRKNEIWPFAATWMELEGIMLSEISQAEKGNRFCFEEGGSVAFQCVPLLWWILFFFFFFLIFFF